MRRFCEAKLFQRFYAWVFQELLPAIFLTSSKNISETPLSHNSLPKLGTVQVILAGVLINYRFFEYLQSFQSPEGHSNQLVCSLYSYETERHSSDFYRSPYGPASTPVSWLLLFPVFMYPSSWETWRKILFSKHLLIQSLWCPGISHSKIVSGHLREDLEYENSISKNPSLIELHV